jgi:hypothetical protein
LGTGAPGCCAEAELSPATGATDNPVLACWAAAESASRHVKAITFLMKPIRIKAADILLLQKRHKLLQTTIPSFRHLNQVQLNERYVGIH